MNHAYKMEPWALGADLYFLSVILFTLPLFLSFVHCFFLLPLSLPSFSTITLADCNL